MSSIRSLYWDWKRSLDGSYCRTLRLVAFFVCAPEILGRCDDHAILGPLIFLCKTSTTSIISIPGYIWNYWVSEKSACKFKFLLFIYRSTTGWLRWDRSWCTETRRLFALLLSDLVVFSKLNYWIIVLCNTIISNKVRKPRLFSHFYSNLNFSIAFFTVVYVIW